MPRLVLLKEINIRTDRRDDRGEVGGRTAPTSAS
jgi:hypothetical protein